MTLSEYLISSGITDADFAGRTGVHFSLVGRWRRGEVIPRPERMRLIYDMSGGAVAPNDFYGIPGATGGHNAKIQE